jgi:ArsR family transcriptional regulator
LQAWHGNLLYIDRHRSVWIIISTLVNGRTGLTVKESQVRDSLCCLPLTKAPLSAREADDLASVLSALSDPIRLRLLSLVAAQGEVCSCHLEKPLAKSQPTISHHTRVLADAGLIVGERRGKWMWWRIVPERLAALGQLLGGSPSGGDYHRRSA